MIAPANSARQVSQDGDLQAVILFSLTNDIPMVLPEDISPSFTRYDGHFSNQSNFTKENLMFFVSPVQIYEDEGYYNVTVRNPAGYSEASVYLDVQSKSTL